MLEIAKRENGITIFDIEDLTKVNLTTDFNSTFLISYDTRLKEEYIKKISGGAYFWYIHVVAVLSEHNPELYEKLKVLHSKLFEELINNRQIYERNLYGMDSKLIRTVNGEYVEIKYPSDDDDIKSATFHSIIEYKSGIGLAFEKTVKDFSKKTWLLNKEASHYENLAKIYSEGFMDILTIADKEYSECQEKLQESFARKMKQY